MRTTKKEQILKHLIENGNITSWGAIQLYYATRLSAIIFDLRKEGYNIKTENVKMKDANGNTTVIANYILEK